MDHEGFLSFLLGKSSINENVPAAHVALTNEQLGLNQQNTGWDIYWIYITWDYPLVKINIPF
jgi:hypothetical protein